MNSSLSLWMEENSELFKYAVDVLALKRDIKNVLLSGGASTLLAGVYSAICGGAHIVAACDREDFLEDGKSECESLEVVKAPCETYAKEKSFDLAVSVLQIQSLNTRELTPYLFNLYDSLVTGGVLYLSFPDAVDLTTMEKNLYPAWYSMDEEVYMKYYMAHDVINALSLIGFEIKAIESDDNKSLGHVVSVLCIKK